MERHIFDFYQSSMETELHGNRGHQKFSCLNKKVKCHDEKPVYSFGPDQGSNYRLKGRTWKTHQKINMKISHHSRKTERKTLGGGRLDAADSQKSKSGIYGQMLRLSKMLTFSLWKCIPARPMSQRAPEIHSSSAAPKHTLAGDASSFSWHG